MEIDMKKLNLWACALLLSSGLAASALAQESERRFKLTPLAEMTPAQRAVADAIRSGPRAAVGSSATAEVATIGSPFNVWLRSPELADHLQKLGSHIRFKTSLPARLNEFAILVTARHWTSQYEWVAHHRLALAGGLNPQIAQDLSLGKRPDNMQADEAIIYDFSTEMHRTHKVSDATYKAAVDKFGEQGVVDLIAVNGYYVLVAMTLNVDRTPVPGDKPPLAVIK
jgi:4-carboxymuconolactone decarboxylase